MYRTPRALGGLTAAIILLGLILALTINPFNLPIFFATMAFAILIGSLTSGRPNALYSGIMGGIWMFILAMFFVTHIWIVFLVGVLLSILMGSLKGPIVSRLSGMPNMYNNQPNQPFYQPPQQPQQPNQPYYQPPQQPYQPYQEGYQPPTPRPGESYQESGRQYQYPPQQSPQYESPETQYNQPKAQYPQQMPPNNQTQ